MKKLEERIKADGRYLPGDILKIDSFLNHQIDVKLVEDIGEEFHRLFADTNPTKILTIESSGIAIASMTARYFGYIPVIYAKKTLAANMSENAYEAKEVSYTRNIEYTVQVAKEYLNDQDRVLIIDDFLARGEAMNSLISICDQAKAKIVGCGTVVSKAYQPGEKRIRNLGYEVKVLARIVYMDENKIEFEESL